MMVTGSSDALVAMIAAAWLYKYLQPCKVDARYSNIVLNPVQTQLTLCKTL